jgi:hypothetical protein
MNGDYSDVRDKLDDYYDHYTNKNRLYILTDYNLLINGKSAAIQDTGVAVKHYGDSMKFMLYSKRDELNFRTIDTSFTDEMLLNYGSR